MPAFERPDLIQIFPSFVWRAQLKPDEYGPLNRGLLRALAATGMAAAETPVERVAELVASGVGARFAPAGRVFREWVAVRDLDRDCWRGLLLEGIAFVGRDGSGCAGQGGAGM